MPANHILHSPAHEPHVPGQVHHHERLHRHPGRPKTQHEKLVENGQKLVSQTFFGTMLKQMHNSPFKSKLFSGGRGGEAFGSLMDQHLADRMASGAGGGLVDSMVHKWEHPRPPKDVPAAMRAPAVDAGLKVRGYRNSPATQWRPNVTADLRA